MDKKYINKSLICSIRTEPFILQLEIFLSLINNAISGGRSERMEKTCFLILKNYSSMHKSKCVWELYAPLLICQKGYECLRKDEINAHGKSVARREIFVKL